MRTRLLAFTSSLALTGLLLVGCGSDPAIQVDGSPASGPTPAAAEGVDLSTAAFADLTAEASPEIDAFDNVFKPKFVEVTAGTEITFRNGGRTAHNVLPVVEGAFAPVEASAFEPGAETTVAFGEPGDFAYYCSLHGTTSKGMVGAVRVVE